MIWGGAARAPGPAPPPIRGSHARALRPRATQANPPHLLIDMATTSLLLLLPATAWAHGSMYEPPSRNSGGMAVLSPTCAGGACQWYSQGCSIGCAECSQKYSAEPDCENPAEQTLLFGEDDDLIAYHRRPQLGDDLLPVALPGQGARARQLRRHGRRHAAARPAGPPTGHLAGDTAPTRARARAARDAALDRGSVVEVAFGLAAGHGGGFQYRQARAARRSTRTASSRRR